MHGVPVWLVTEAQVETRTGNWSLVDASKNGQQSTDQPGSDLRVDGTTDEPAPKETPAVGDTQKPDAVATKAE